MSCGSESNSKDTWSKDSSQFVKDISIFKKIDILY